MIYTGGIFVHLFQILYFPYFLHVTSFRIENFWFHFNSVVISRKHTFLPELFRHHDIVCAGDSNHLYVALVTYYFSTKIWFNTWIMSKSMQCAKCLCITSKYEYGYLSMDDRVNDMIHWSGQPFDVWRYWNEIFWGPIRLFDNSTLSRKRLW